MSSRVECSVVLVSAIAFSVLHKSVLMAVGVSHDSAEGLISKIVKKVKGYFVRTGLSGPESAEISRNSARK
jgi:hypothetical protein